MRFTGRLRIIAQGLPVCAMVLVFKLLRNSLYIQELAYFLTTFLAKLKSAVSPNWGAKSDGFGINESLPHGSHI
jgi:hypothetical protein